MCFSINDNEGVAEMLIESLGTNIINTSDSKGRWAKRSALKCRTLDFYVVWALLYRFSSMAGPPFTPRPFLTTWSASPCY